MIYPAPNMIVGVGRFGLATLERLAEDWHRLRLSSDDPSLKNLRLLHVRPQDDGLDPSWRAPERQFVEIARYTGDGDLPSLALDLAILRTLGLVRYRDGSYQVAVPRDGGIIEHGDRRDVARRRYFEWLTLDPDPIASAERLVALDARYPELGLFIRPLIHRVRQGHSPRALLACISRLRALAQGRDPSPWTWTREALQERAPDATERGARLRFDAGWLTAPDREGVLEGLAPAPMRGWSEWFERHASARSGLEQARLDAPDSFDLLLPPQLLPTRGDLPSPLQPMYLLRVDWETNGWAMSGSGGVEFTPVHSSMFRLGMFDHDGSSRIRLHGGKALADRLVAFSREVHRGLVRLWVDLQRNRVEPRHSERGSGKRRDEMDLAMRQSLEALGGLLVRPLVEAQRAREDHDAFEAPPSPARKEYDQLPHLASPFLGGLEIDDLGGHSAVRNVLSARLYDLGFSAHGEHLGLRPLMREIVIAPEDVQALDTHESFEREHDALDGVESVHGLLDFRATINQLTRDLFDFDFMARYRRRPTRRPPRLTIWVVADMGEPFARTTVRALLREIHAELLRAYGPIFETYREGFDRALNVIPLLWMPHPADAFGGRYPVHNRCEEAAIIESIQGIRRWVELIPSGIRCIPQVIINSRVTDNAVLTIEDAITQTRDFMSFQIRNDISREEWLRQTVVGPFGEDFFASFSCHEISFPAERAREYLANRLARDCIAQIKRGEQQEVELDESVGEGVKPPSIEELVKPAVGRTRQQTHRAAEATAGFVEERVQVSADASAAALQRAFDEEFEDELLRQIYTQWRTLTRSRGDMDAMMGALRRDTSAHLSQTLKHIHKTGDLLIDEHASKGGLRAAQAGFGQLEGITREQLLASEASRKRGEHLCQEHRIPQTSPIASAREAVVSAAGLKPDHVPMIFALVVWLMMAPALGAAPIQALARALDLPTRMGPAELILGPLAPVVGGILVFVPMAWFLRYHMNTILQRIRDAVEQLAETTRKVVEGSGGAFSGSPSIRSFIEARLQLTAALAGRNYALRVHERVIQDASLAHRISRSVDIQEDALMRRAEDLGVRAQMISAGRGAAPAEDDLTQLFTSRGRGRHDHLVDPQQLQGYYKRHYGSEQELRAIVPSFIEHTGGFTEWRKRACMADTEAILSTTRERFDEVVRKPVAEQYTFEEEVGESLSRFVVAHYSNMGFGAKFIGYEGLDPDGVHVVCDAALVIHPALRRVFDRARTAQGRPMTETMDIRETQVLPNSAYMLSFAQGIRPHSLRNLIRFESFHDRVRMPDDRTFPRDGEGGPISHLTGFDDLKDALNETLLGTLITRADRQLGYEPPDDARPDDRPDDPRDPGPASDGPQLLPSPDGAAAEAPDTSHVEDAIIEPAAEDAASDDAFDAELERALATAGISGASDTTDTPELPPEPAPEGVSGTSATRDDVLAIAPVFVEDLTGDGDADATLDTPLPEHPRADEPATVDPTDEELDDLMDALEAELAAEPSAPVEPSEQPEQPETAETVESPETLETPEAIDPPLTDEPREAGAHTRGFIRDAHSEWIKLETMGIGERPTLKRPSVDDGQAADPDGVLSDTDPVEQPSSPQENPQDPPTNTQAQAPPSPHPGDLLEKGPGGEAARTGEGTGFFYEFAPDKVADIYDDPTLNGATPADDDEESE